MKKIILVCAFVLSATAAHASTVILEKKNTNPQGIITQDVLVHSDGTATETHLVGSGHSQPVLVATFDKAALAQVNASIASLRVGPLVQLNPDQHYNPGGFGADYSVTDANGNTYVFAKNVSGVDFGVAVGQVQNLINILDTLN